MTPSNALKILIVMVKGCDFIEGSTRFRCYAFLAKQTIPELKEFDFYDDWLPSKFGPISNLFNKELSGSLGITIGKWAVRNPAGHLVDRYGLMMEGERITLEFASSHPGILNKVQGISRHYLKYPLISVEHELITEFPNYWLRGKSKSEAVGLSGATGTFLDHAFDEVDGTEPG